MKLRMTRRVNGKPAILCLHGGGTSSAIFEIQTIRLRNALSPRFDFVFVNAPFSTAPGPGVLPFFVGLGPYFTWGDPDLVERGLDPDSCAPEETTTLLRNIISQQAAKTGDHFVGVMGFSFGARVAAGLLLEKENRDRLRREDEEPSQSPPAGFLFGVFLNATYPPFTPHGSAFEPSLRISIPTLHAIGNLDPYRPKSEMLLANACDKNSARSITFQIDHRLPVTIDDTSKLAAEIFSLYDRALELVDGL